MSSDHLARAGLLNGGMTTEMDQKLARLRAVRQDLLDTPDAPPADVPCGTCTACCRNGELIALLPERGDDLTVLSQHTEIAGVRVLHHKPNGECVYLEDDGCSVHENRPFVCKGFDCRVLHHIKSRRELRAMVKNGEIAKTVVKAGAERLHTLDIKEERRKMARAR